jgi:hypothetical protein
MSLKEQMPKDAVSCFLNDGEFAEEITYTTGAGISKVIKAVVVRYELAPAEENHQPITQSRRKFISQTDEASGVTYGKLKKMTA